MSKRRDRLKPFPESGYPHLMFICVCHALSDKDIRSAEACGANSEKQIFSHFGLQPECGHCVDAITGFLKCRNSDNNAGIAGKQTESRVNSSDSHGPLVDH